MAGRRLTDTESSQEGKEASHDHNPFELCSGFSAGRQKLSGRVHESVRSGHLSGTLASECGAALSSFRHRLHFSTEYSSGISRLLVHDSSCQGLFRFFEPRVYSPPGLGASGNIQNSISTSNTIPRMR